MPYYFLIYLLDEEHRSFYSFVYLRDTIKYYKEICILKDILSRNSIFINAFACRYIKFLIFFIIVTNHIVLQAQNGINPFKKILIEVDGEEIFEVEDIIQDHQGFLWMATNLGLIRYDGFEGKKYYSDLSSTDDNGGGINTLYVDSQGDLWIGSISGLRKYNPDCDCILKYPSIIDDFKLTNIQTITEDLDDNIWIGALNEGLLRYNRESNDFTRVLHNSSGSIKLIIDNVYHLLVDQKNNLWIGLQAYDSKKGPGLVRYNINSGHIEQFTHDPSNPNSLVDNRISALYEDTLGQIFIGTYKSGFHIYDSKTGSIKRIIYNPKNPNQMHAPFTKENVVGKDPFVQIIHQDQNGNYWIGTTGKGINFFNTRKKTFKNYDLNLVNPQVLRSIYEDRQGNIWIGAVMGAGLFKTDPFERKYHLNKNFNSIGSSYESAFNPGIIWVNSLQLGLSKFNLKTNEITRYVSDKGNSKSIGHNWVRSAYQENKETLWFGIGYGGAEGNSLGDGGIDRMDIESGTFTHFKLTRNDDGKDGFSYTPYSICEDSEGYLWVSGAKGGLFRSDKEKKTFKPFKLNKNDNTSGDVILNIVRKDSNGDIWASDFKDEGTLYLYNREEDTFNPYLKGFKVFNILIDEQGWYIIGTWKKGLLHLNPSNGSFTQYTKKDGLPSNIGVDIIAGDEGDIWIQTRMGPAKFDAKTGKITSVGLLKGNYNTSILKASDGQIYLGDKTNNALLSFYPHQVIGNPYPPQVDISSLLISETEYLTRKSNANELVFSHNQNDISFKYNALHFSNSEKNQYQYRLKPINEQWINAGFERTARFFNLPPNDYTFEVKASNSDGVWSETPEIVSFTIKPAWWTTWWAYLMYVLAFAFLTERLYRFQLSKHIADSESKRLKEVDQLKNTLFTNITHEFRTPLTVIKGMTGAIKSNLDNYQHDDLENALNIIDRNSDWLLHLINEMLDLAKIESGNMELNLVQANIIPYIKYLTQSFHSLAEEKNINFSVHCDLEELEMDLDVNKFTTIVTNLISNAIKFTPKNGNVQVHIDRIQDYNSAFVKLKVKDSGLGITNEEQLQIFDKYYQVDNTSSRSEKGTGIGLSLVKEFVQLMKGSIEVESVKEKGSTFSIQIPITNNAPQMDEANFALTPFIFKSGNVSISTKENQAIDSVDENLPLVLIAEDNNDVAYYIKTCLDGKYQVIHASNGAIGIEKALEKIPDIIISDVMMPEKDGFELCERLKNDELTDHIPIIMLTAKATFEDRLTGLLYGADAYLTKPFEKAELLTRIEQLILLRKKILKKFEKTGLDRIISKNVKNTETKFLKKVILKIHDNLTKADFGPEQLALQLHLSDSQLYRKLKATIGKPTALFIRSIRLQKGKEMIQSTDKTVSEIAYDVGFNDPSYFSRAFKKEFGHAPSKKAK